MNDEKFSQFLTDEKDKHKNEIKRDSNIGYSSTQLNLEGKDKEDIFTFNNQLIDINDLHEYGMEKDIHITVKYGLHDQTPEKLYEIVKQIDSISVVFGKTSIFKSEQYDVVKYDILSQDLRKLNKLISSDLECTDTFKIYKPHCTIAYVKTGLGEKYVGDTIFEGKQLTFNKLIFSPKEGEDTLLYFNKISNIS